MKCFIISYSSKVDARVYYQVYISTDGAFFKIEEIYRNSVVASATPKRETNFRNLLKNVDFYSILNSVEYTC